MIDARFRPITEWPGTPTKAERRGGSNVFKAGYQDTLNILERELRHLNAKNIVIEAYFELGQIRNDGWPLGRATPSRPGVMVSFQSNRGMLRIPCDHFGKWEHNLRAIALHLEHLRLASLYGVGLAGQAYTGWKQIAAPAAELPKMSVEDAAIYVNAFAEHVPFAEALVHNSETYRAAYRKAAAILHPDITGGRNGWLKLQEAKAVLDAHHNLTKAQEARG